MPPPMAMPTTVSRKPEKPDGGLRISVVSTAIPMPIMP